MSERYWEIDCLRGIAIMMMIIFHTIFDLAYARIYGFNIYSGFWFLFARITASIFIFLVGLSLTISYTRSVKQRKYRKKFSLFGKYLRRGLKIFILGLVITSVTWILVPQDYIVFGILHFIGVSIILAYPFLRWSRWSSYLSLGALLILIGLFIRNFTFDFPWLLWLGFMPENFYTLDYFSILPWFGLILIGMYFGNLLYPNGNRRFKVKDLSKFLPTRILSFLGRHSLIIYFLHQPILIAILYILIL